MQEELISVVVPVYNSGKYLRTCLDSIIRQAYQNLEIIIIDDGSTDDSREICINYASTDARIKLICQENNGVAKARKRGVLSASGSLLGFVDSDDFIGEELFTKLFHSMQDMDLVTSGYYYDYDQKSCFFDSIPAAGYKNNEEMRYIYENMILNQNNDEKGILPNLVAKLFKTELAKQVAEEIDESVFYGEDAEFLYRYLLKCKAINITDICDYCYRMHENSLVHSAHKNYLMNVNILYMSLEKVFNEHPQKEILQLQLQRWISGLIASATEIMGFCEKAQNIRFIFPYLNELRGKQIVLYGAGMIGRNYYRQICRLNEGNVILWVDQEWKKYREKGMCIHDIREVTKTEFDYLIIAVKNRQVADEIKIKLKEMEVEEGKILWRKPVSITF